MLFNRLYKNTLKANFRQLSFCSVPSLKRQFPFKCIQNSRNAVFPITSSYFLRCRHYSDNTEHFTFLPPLSENEKIISPSIFNILTGLFNVYYVIKPNLDKEFDIDDFLEGSKIALSTVSNALAREDYESLQGLVTNDVINNLRNKISSLSDEQKQLITVHYDDIRNQFPYKVGIMSDDDNDKQKSVEVTVVYYTIRDFAEFKNKMDSSQFFMNFDPDFKKRSFICNYRFIRTYGENVGDHSWTINYINQFSLNS